MVCRVSVLYQTLKSDLINSIFPIYSLLNNKNNEQKTVAEKKNDILEPLIWIQIRDITKTTNIPGKVKCRSRTSN